MLKKSYHQFLKNKPTLILILFGFLSWSLTMIKSSPTSGFWGANGHDGIWHIALANQLAKGKLLMPTFAGASLQNYHIGFDLLLAVLHKLTTISISTLYFQILPPIFAILIGILTYHFVLTWQKSKSAAFWSTFFVYFGGSFGWLIGKGESAFWSQQAVSTLINPPFALSLIFLLIGLIFLQKTTNKYSIRHTIYGILSFGFLIQVKAYAGLLALAALLIILIFSTILHRVVEKQILTIFIGSLTISLIIFIPFNKNATSLLVFKPFWFLETMMQLTDRVGWVRYGEAMQNYKWGNNFIKGIPAYTIAFAIFWFGNMGIRALGLFHVPHSFLVTPQALLMRRGIKSIKFKSLNIFIYSVILLGLLIPMLFLQKGTPWNTIQFFYYSLFFASILMGIFISKLKSRILISIIILFTIPTTLITLNNNYLPTRPPSELPPEEFEALNFLKSQPDGVVLTFPFDEYKSKSALSNPPRPLYLYVSTAYVSAFSEKISFLEDEINLTITNFDWKARREEIEEFYASLNQDFVYNFLRENNISYVYWIGKQRATLGETQLGIKQIFDNNFVKIYKVM